MRPSARFVAVAPKLRSALLAQPHLLIGPRCLLSNLSPISQLFPIESFAFSWTFAEGERFELSVPFGTHAFQACALDHYANPPMAS